MEAGSFTRETQRPQSSCKFDRAPRVSGNVFRLEQERRSRERSALSCPMDSGNAFSLLQSLSMRYSSAFSCPMDSGSFFKLLQPCRFRYCSLDDCLIESGNFGMDVHFLRSSRSKLGQP